LQKINEIATTFVCQLNEIACLLGVMNETTAPNKQFVCVERALAIAMVVLLIVAACAFAKIGAFANFDYSHIIGFSCMSLSAFFALIKGTLLSLQCCKSYVRVKAHTRFRCTKVTITEKEKRNAIPQ
jgi:ABC-type enterochelin transport system permease subunit